MKILATVPGGSVYLSDEQVLEVSPTVLAYVGDAVWELFVRTQLIVDTGGLARARDLHAAALGSVNAKAQARLLVGLAGSLSTEEHDIIRRGRNVRPHHAIRSSDPGQYRQSTGFEALLGYAYLTGRTERLDELLHMAMAALRELDGNGGVGETEGRDGQ